MKLTITIDMDNAAFENVSAGSEVARILRRVCKWVDGCTAAELKHETHSLKDINGNTVGEVVFH